VRRRQLDRSGGEQGSYGKAVGGQKSAHGLRAHARRAAGSDRLTPPLRLTEPALAAPMVSEHGGRLQSRGDISCRRATLEDAEACGKICHEAFCKVSAEHDFFPDPPSPEGTMTMLFATPGYFAVVAEDKGRILGSNVLDEPVPTRRLPRRPDIPDRS
jgi:hypothetical protein